MNALRYISAVLFAVIAVGVNAAAGPIIRTRIAPASVVIGQPVTLTIDILVPTWFAGGIEYPPTIALPDALAKLSDEHPVNLNERIGSESYAGMSKTYVIVPQKQGVFDVPAVTMRVPYAADGKTVVAEVRSAPQRFEARLPPGAEDLGYFIATRSYRLTQQVDPLKLAALKVGDALTRTIAQRASDLAPMFLPALTFEPVDGIELYPTEPVLGEQGGERGSARIATRSDSATYVLAKSGRYRLPGLRIGWFDPSQGVMRWASVPELAFDVAENPVRIADATAAIAPQQGASPSYLERIVTKWKEGLAALLCLLAAGFTVRWLLPATRRCLRDWRARRAMSEATAFRHLRLIAHSGNAAAVRHAAAQWSAHTVTGVEPMVLSRVVHEHGDHDLAGQLESLDRLLYRQTSEGGAPWSAPEFVRGLIAARRRWRQSRRARQHQDPGLAPLNPGRALRQK